jgi:hypothetical protein
MKDKTSKKALARRIRKLETRASVKRAADNLKKIGAAAAERVGKKLQARGLVKTAKVKPTDHGGDFSKGSFKIGIWYRFQATDEGKKVDDLTTVVDDIDSAYTKGHASIAGVGIWWIGGGNEIVCGTYVTLKSNDVEDIVDEWAQDNLK